MAMTKEGYEYWIFESEPTDEQLASLNSNDRPGLLSQIWNGGILRKPTVVGNRAYFSYYENSWASYYDETTGHWWNIPDPEFKSNLGKHMVGLK